MADLPRFWEAYARLQRKLSSTYCIATAAALEEALNIVHRPAFQPEGLTDNDLERFNETAARRERYRAQLLRQNAAEQNGGFVITESVDGLVNVAPRSLDDQVHAFRELARLEALMRGPDWDLLTGVATGVSYERLAIEQASSAAALRSRVCRLRQSIA